MSKRILPVLIITLMGPAGTLSLFDFARTPISPSKSPRGPSAAPGAAAPPEAGSPLAGSLFLQPTAAHRTSETTSIVVFMGGIIQATGYRLEAKAMGYRLQASGYALRSGCDRFRGVAV